MAIRSTCSSQRSSRFSLCPSLVPWYVRRHYTYVSLSDYAKTMMRQALLQSTAAPVPDPMLAELPEPVEQDLSRELKKLRIGPSPAAMDHSG